MSRRVLLKAGAAGLLAAGAAPIAGCFADSNPRPAGGFRALRHDRGDQLLVPPGYEHTVVVRWGDPLSSSAPEFDPLAQTPAAQAVQFGANNDYIGFFSLPAGSGASDRGLLVVNHEFTAPELMFHDWDPEVETKTREMVDIELAAHGLSVVEVRRDPAGCWRYVRESGFNRRLTATSPFELVGPAAGHRWLCTSADPTGRRVLGTLYNCSGGMTPWGTALSAEENFHYFFSGLPPATAEPGARRVHERYPSQDAYGWAPFYDRFDVAKEPNEALRFGWVVEVDPFDPRSRPVKRTALGRFKHEAANVSIAKGGRVVVYSGDDERFEYLYKFVSDGIYDPDRPEVNRTLLDSGTLYAARFRDDGTGEWLPLRFGEGPLTEAGGFGSQAEVLINARAAADRLGATPMDRPEDVEANPRTGKVYAVMTNNTRRRADQVDGPNPRAENRHGHIIEISEAGGDQAATAFAWEILIASGDPGDPRDQADYQGRATESWFSCPDNIAFDDRGRLWVATDGQPSLIDRNDAVYMVELEGERRGSARMFLSGLPGGEICGPQFTPDNRTLFVTIQHPGDGRGSTFSHPISRFPDYQDGLPPRASVVAVFRPDGRKIGT